MKSNEKTSRERKKKQNVSVDSLCSAHEFVAGISRILGRSFKSDSRLWSCVQLLALTYKGCSKCTSCKNGLAYDCDSASPCTINVSVILDAVCLLYFDFIHLWF